MIRVTRKQANEQWDDLIAAALRGESVHIECGPEHRCGVVSLTFAGYHSGCRGLGSMRGTFTIADNFDDPLEDFEDYQ